VNRIDVTRGSLHGAIVVDVVVDLGVDVDEELGEVLVDVRIEDEVDVVVAGTVELDVEVELVEVVDLVVVLEVVEVVVLEVVDVVVVVEVVEVVVLEVVDVVVVEDVVDVVELGGTTDEVGLEEEVVEVDVVEDVVDEVVDDVVDVVEDVDVVDDVVEVDVVDDVVDEVVDVVELVDVVEDVVELVDVVEDEDVVELVDVVEDVDVVVVGAVGITGPSVPKVSPVLIAHATKVPPRLDPKMFICAFIWGAQRSATTVVLEGENDALASGRTNLQTPVACGAMSSARAGAPGTKARLVPDEPEMFTPRPFTRICRSAGAPSALIWEFGFTLNRSPTSNVLGDAVVTVLPPFALTVQKTYWPPSSVSVPLTVRVP
jgi:hypothetical protein